MQRLALDRLGLAENIAAPVAQKPPKLICVGTGRDGTVSVSRMIQHVFDGTDARRAMHEYCAREFYQAFCEYKETGNSSHVEEIRRLIVDCPYDCVVGNGYAAVLPWFREHWGPNTKLVHIRRRNRDACIASCVKSCEMFPEAYGYYSSPEGAVVKRIAAFHFNEMTKSEWDRMPTAAKFGWYYDKTHALIAEHKGLFAETIDIFTEDLSEEQTRRTIAQLAGVATRFCRRGPMPISKSLILRQYRRSIVTRQCG